MSEVPIDRKNGSISGHDLSLTAMFVLNSLDNGGVAHSEFPANSLEWIYFGGLSEFPTASS